MPVMKEDQGWNRPWRDQVDIVLLCHFSLQLLGSLDVKKYMDHFIFPFLFLPLPANLSQPRVNFGICIAHPIGPGIYSNLKAVHDPVLSTILFMRYSFAL